MQTIVIVGGGAGGLELATSLGNKLGKRKKARVILVDKDRTHIWKPLLHELATGALDRSTDGVVYHAHAARHHYQFQLGTMTGMDAANKEVMLDALHGGQWSGQVRPVTAPAKGRAGQTRSTRRGNVHRA